MSEAEHPDDIVRLATAANAFQAHLWEQALKAQGISCKVVGDYLEAGIGNITGLKLEVWVHRDDVVRAEAVLARGTETSGEEPAPEA